MFYDNTYALGAIFQTFLKDHNDILEDLRDILSGDETSSTDTSETLLKRFEHWISEQDIEIDNTQKNILLEVVAAFANLASELEEVESLVLV